MNLPVNFTAASEERGKAFTYTFWAKNFAHRHVVVFAVLIKKKKSRFKIFCLDELDEVAYKLVWRHLVILAEDDSAQRITRCVASGRVCRWERQQ